MGQEGRSTFASFWSSLPGVFTGLAALITAGGGLYALTREQAEALPVRTEAADKAEPTANAAAPAALPDTGSETANAAAEAVPAEQASSPAPVADPPATAGLTPAGCITGYVWREARVGDYVCVAPETRGDTMAENHTADSRRSPDGGAYGADTCSEGFVWREAFEGDTVCVDPASRERAHRDNEAAPEHRAGS